MEEKDGRFVLSAGAADITVGRVLGPVEGRKYGPEKAGWCRVSWSAVNTRVKREEEGEGEVGYGRRARGAREGFSAEDVDKRGFALSEARVVTWRATLAIPLPPP